MASYAEIQEQIAQLQKEAEQLRKSELASVIAEVKEKMAQYGLTLDDLKGVKKAKGTSTVAAKYRDPITGAEWTGRGRAPLWIANSGKAKEDFLI
jgi:DNA-binding protein H-NS